MTKMRRLLLVVAVLLGTSVAMAAEALWLRYPAISPDGRTIAFNYKGDIYLVAAKGGKARLLVSHEAYDYSPIWSPDGKQIAFASDRHGNFDIFTIPVTGGEPRRVTTHSNDEEPWAFSPDGKQVYFSANLQTSAASRVYSNKWRKYLRELYAVPVVGGRPRLILPTPAEEISCLSSGDGFLYQDRPGHEEIWRKHHTSAVTRDIWLYRGGKHTKLTTTPCEDRVPRLSADGKTIYFLSERDGSFNVYSFPFDQPDKVTCHTSHKLHPVRSLSVARDETLCYSYDGSLYIKRKGAKPQCVQISVPETAALPIIKQRVRPSDVATVSPDGKQMVFAHRGELYVTTTDEETTTRRITNTVASEADPVFSHDGRTLVYASERQGKWNLFSITLGKDDANFMTAEKLEEKPLFADTNFDRRMPLFSPDGKELSFIEERSRLMVRTLATGAVRQVTDGEHITQTWGTYPYSWSPDGKWFVLEGDITKHKDNILLVKASGREPIINLSRSGYPDSNPIWALGGDAILFLSQRYGTYDHSRLGGGSKSLFMFCLNRAAYERYTIPASRHDQLNMIAPTTGEVRPVTIDPFGFNDRLVRLTQKPVSNLITDRKGDYAYGISGKKLVRINLRKANAPMKVLGSASGKLVWDATEKTIFVLGGKPQRYDVATGKFAPIAVSGTYEIDRAAEYLFMHDHITNEIQQRFYDKKMHGCDWQMYCKAYRRFVPHINNNYDFAELASELLGELNVSHTGLAYTRPTRKSHDATAELGVYIDHNYTGKGLKIEEILTGGPFDRTTSQLAAGDIIEQIDGVTLTAGMDYYPLLNHKAGKLVQVVIRKASGQRVEESVYPITRDVYDELLYQRWMARNAADVERLSGGKLGYVHLFRMDKHGYHHLYLNTLGRYYNCEALVFDVRNNAGGSLHPKIEEFFCGTQYLTGEVRGVLTKTMPRRRWIRPSAMLICPGCYSDGHGAPWVYDHLDLGTTVGTPIPGTMTTCNREKMRDPSLKLGVPIVGFYTQKGNSLENSQTEPDVYVENDKEELARGRDQQLEAIVKLLLEQVKTHPKRPWPHN